MGVYANVNGVIRKASQLRPEAGGAVRTGKYGFCDVYGARRQYFGPLEEITTVKIEVLHGYNCNLDSSGNLSGHSYFDTVTEANRYGSVSITSDRIYVYCDITGKQIWLYATIKAIFADGHDQYLSQISELGPAYGAVISWPVNIDVRYRYFGSSGRVSGYHSFTCGENYLDTGDVGAGASKNWTLTKISGDLVYVAGGVSSGSGSCTAQMTFSPIIIDGRSVPVQVVSALR